MIKITLPVWHLPAIVIITLPLGMVAMTFETSCPSCLLSQLYSVTVPSAARKQQHRQIPLHSGHRLANIPSLLDQ